jgi:hypothetical protein
VDHAFTHFRLRVHPYLAQPERGAARRPAADRARWAGAEDLATLALPRVDRKIIDLLTATPSVRGIRERFQPG